MKEGSINGMALCSGGGGLELGIRLALGSGYRCSVYVEREIAAVATLAGHMEQGDLEPALIWDDLGTFDGRPWRGRIHLISAGVPCQPFSVAGKRKTTADERWIWPEAARIVREVSPEWVFMENVPGFIRGGLGLVIRDLAEAGYRYAYDIFSAAEVGASQLRKRVFLLAHKRRVGCEGTEVSQGRESPVGICNGPLGEPGRECLPGRRDTGDVFDAAGGAEDDGRQRQRLRNTAGDDGATVGNASSNGRQAWPQNDGETKDTQAGEAQDPEPRSREFFGPFPPGPGLGLDSVVEGCLDLLSRDPGAGCQKFLAELAQWAAWQRIIAVRPDLAPATAKQSVRGVADGLERKLGAPAREHVLRLLGNGVVLATAALAFRVLHWRLTWPPA